MPNPAIKQARFVHPSEFGMEFPINTQAELVSIARAINKGFARSNEGSKPNSIPTAIPQVRK